ncbi:MAG: flavodoxin family protein, partial [Clostridium sp.]|nr:flavodoxin family protein [Clostridium sp.]
TTPEGRRHHVKEIGVTQGGFYNEENLKSTKEKFEKYGNITFPSI